MSEEQTKRKRKREDSKKYSGSDSLYKSFRSISFWEPAPKQDITWFWPAQDPGPATPWTEQDSLRSELASQEKRKAQGKSEISEEELIEKLPYDMLEEIMGVIANAEKAEQEEGQALRDRAEARIRASNSQLFDRYDDGYCPGIVYMR